MKFVHQALFATVVTAQKDDVYTRGRSNLKPQLWDWCNAGVRDSGCGKGFKCAYEGVTLYNTKAKIPPGQRDLEWDFDLEICCSDDQCEDKKYNENYTKDEEAKKAYVSVEDSNTVWLNRSELTIDHGK